MRFSEQEELNRCRSNNHKNTEFFPAVKGQVHTRVSHSLNLCKQPFQGHHFSLISCCSSHFTQWFNVRIQQKVTWMFLLLCSQKFPRMRLPVLKRLLHSGTISSFWFPPAFVAIFPFWQQTHTLTAAWRIAKKSHTPWDSSARDYQRLAVAMDTTNTWKYVFFTSGWVTTARFLAEVQSPGGNNKC